MRHSRRRLAHTGVRRNRSRAFNRGASFEALEDRRLLSTVNFTSAGETQNESSGQFAIPVSLSSPPSGTPVVSSFVDINTPLGLAFYAGNLYVADGSDGIVDEVTPAKTIKQYASGFSSPNSLAFDDSGDLYVANISGIVSKVTPAGANTQFAHGFNDPTALAVDSAGNVYVANNHDNTVSVVSPEGTTISFISGFDDPVGLAFDSNDNLYVANGGNGTVSEVPIGGQPKLFASGFDDPVGLAVDPAGNVYVANFNNTNVSMVTPNGAVSVFATPFNHPAGLAFDSAGNLYVANNGNNTVSEVSQTVTVPFTFTGTALKGSAFSTVTLSPLTFGIGQTTQNITGTLLSDPGPDQTMIFRLGTPTGGASLGSDSVNTLTIDEPALVQFSTGSESVSQGTGTFSIPVTLTGTPDGAGVVTVPFTLSGTAASGVAFSGVTANPLTFAAGQTTQNITGTLLSDPGSPQTLTITLGTPNPSGGASLANPAVNTLVIDEPAAVQFSTGGETVSHGAGTFSIPVTLAGTPDGTPILSTFASGLSTPFGVAVDADGDLYVSNASSGTVSKVTAAGKVSTFASGFSFPGALAFDAAGNLYVADGGDGTVKKVTLAGAVSAVASGFIEPLGLAFDAAGNLYVTDGEQGTVSEVTPAGTVSTFASGLDGPEGLAFDSAGNLYVADNAGNTVSKVTPAGQVSTFASGFNVPNAVAVDSAGNLYVTNQGDDTVSVVTLAGVVSTFASGFNRPVGIALDAGSLYVADNSNNTISQVTETITVPFTLSGTAASGVAFSGVTSGVLAFGIGQTTQNITGTLLSDPGANQTLTFTLGTPTGGAALGSPAANMLTINESATGTPTPTPTSTAPLFLGEQRVFSGNGKHKKLRGFAFLFNGALNAGSAQSTGNYHVTQKHGKKPKILRVKSALYNPINFSVTISVNGFNTGKATQATVTGLEGADGTAIPEFESRL